uniref:Uncharacterized protein n=1 Tax=Engystomops pustulosus TaxID=76066 RepID=A0AAV6Z6H2_ENGPU|nr:hypothetical protein GDO81_027530 [Engystomops pustulosus]
MFYNNNSSLNTKFWKVLICHSTFVIRPCVNTLFVRDLCFYSILAAVNSAQLVGRFIFPTGAEQIEYL